MGKEHPGRDAEKAWCVYRAQEAFAWGHEQVAQYLEMLGYRQRGPVI